MRPDRNLFRLRAAIAAAGALLLVAPPSAHNPSHSGVEGRPASAHEIGAPAPARAIVALQPAAPAPWSARREPASATPARNAPSERLSPLPGSAGMIVGIDPETGNLGMPSPEARARMSMSPALDRSMTGLTVVTRPDGSKHLDLRGRFQEYMVLHLTPDGRKVETCVQGPAVEAALRGVAAVSLAPNPAPAAGSAPAPAPAPAREVR